MSENQSIHVHTSVDLIQIWRFKTLKRCIGTRANDPAAHSLPPPMISSFWAWTTTLPKPARVESPGPICQNSKWRVSLEFMYSFNLMSCMDRPTLLVMFECEPTALHLPNASPHLPSPFMRYVKKPITKSEWWNIISSELRERTTVATSCLHPHM